MTSQEWFIELRSDEARLRQPDPIDRFNSLEAAWKYAEMYMPEQARVETRIRPERIEFAVANRKAWVISVQQTGLVLETYVGGYPVHYVKVDNTDWGIRLYHDLDIVMIDTHTQPIRSEEYE